MPVIRCDGGDSSGLGAWILVKFTCIYSPRVTSRSFFQVGCLLESYSNSRFCLYHPGRMAFSFHGLPET